VIWQRCETFVKYNSIGKKKAPESDLAGPFAFLAFGIFFAIIFDTRLQHFVLHPTLPVLYPPQHHGVTHRTLVREVEWRARLQG